MNELGPYLASLPRIAGSIAGPLMSLLFPSLEIALNSLASLTSSFG
jgi:hypothetical protein